MKKRNHQRKLNNIWKYVFLLAVLVLSFTQLGWMYSDDTVLVPVRVEKGETLWHIATVAADGDTDVRNVVNSILKANHLAHNDDIYPGQVLQVPVGSHRVSLLETTFTTVK
ncbi:MAG: LysM peptidoglycan-binding domain-containing protein [Megasphaera sp.]|jgi:nucleoid-associated protein YgaU|nr:LysM peptidoglycan-binding domain-containing protein [Megasphaera sp.]